MKVSIIIPCYGNPKTLDDTLQSIIIQDYNSYEVVIIDDNSNKYYSELLNRIVSKYFSLGLDIIYESNEGNCGVAISRNKAVNLASGDLICFLDSDDIMLEGKLDKQSRLFRDSNINWVITNASIVDMDGTEVKDAFYEKNPIVTNRIYYDNYIVTSTVMIRRNFLLKENIFFKNTKTGSDWDLWIRMSKLSQPIYLDEKLTSYRINSEGLTRDCSPLTLFLNQTRIFSRNLNFFYLPHFLFFNLKKLVIRYARKLLRWEKKY